MSAAWAAHRAAEDVLSFIVMFGLLDVVMYRTSAWRAFWARRKYQMGVPPDSFQVIEALRSLRTVLVGWGYEVLMVAAQRHWGWFTHIDIVGEHASFGPGFNAAEFALFSVYVALAGELHFYATHRLLHSVPYLYKHVHSVPDPWSGLSFHVVEAVIFFSALPVVIAAWPGHISYASHRFFFLGLVLGAGGVHAAHDAFPLDAQRIPRDVPFVFIPSAYHHNVHHVKVVYNFGGFPLWDVVFGTLDPSMNHFFAWTGLVRAASKPTLPARRISAAALAAATTTTTSTKTSRLNRRRSKSR